MTGKVNSKDRQRQQSNYDICGAPVSQPSEAFSYLFIAFHLPFGPGLASYLIPFGVGYGVAGSFSLQC